mgnify:CR=1 FL=1|tara:strand:- start:638 stop:1324 length:687 start_codon:yes stop_codon:yes gene_type:complete
MPSNETLRNTHTKYSNLINKHLINKRFDKFIKQENKDFGDDVWGLIKEYAIDPRYMEMKRIKEEKELKRQKEFDEFMKRHKQYRIKINTDRYTELKNKLNKTTRNARKNKDWSKSISIYDVEHTIYNPPIKILNNTQQPHNFLFGKRFGSFIWVKTDEWKIYKIYERWITYNYKTRRQYQLHNNYDRTYLRLKKLEEYITLSRDINTHHKSTMYNNNKKLIDSIMETS